MYYEQLLTCEDVDECMGGTVTCSPATQCVNVPGSFFCGCNSGYIQSSLCDQCIIDNNSTGDANQDTCVAEIGAGNSCCTNIDECSIITLNLCPTDSVCQVFKNDL